MSLEIVPIEGIGAVAPGDDLLSILGEALGDLRPRTGDVLVVTHKIVSKAEGRVVHIDGDPEEFKQAFVEAEAKSIVRRRGDLIIAETKHGFICANAGIDRSNAESGTMILLPEDPDRSARRIKQRIDHVFGIDLAVIISDTFGRPWRRGLTDVAIGVAGMAPILDLKGTTDWSGYVLDVTEVSVADELASAADLVMGKAAGIPAALIRGYQVPAGDGSGSDLVRPPSEDLFR
ncbi:MAG: coenzyme F420-0:L-glutamate ligase [Acidimicrobiia bacterium]|nr:coenzyme F420-0:L-glutamate ligase [Acidimicrobiia bacterium]